jgi:chemotaxis signal transduction protein
VTAAGDIVHALRTSSDGPALESGGRASAADGRDPRAPWLVFRVGRAEYAIPLGAVGEIVMPGQLHLIPRVPIAVGGMLNTRGEPLAAVDGGLALGGRSAGGQRHVLVLAADGVQIGVIVDAVLRIERELDVQSERMLARERTPAVRSGAPETSAGCDGVASVEWKRRRDDTPVGVVDAAALVRRATDLLSEHRDLLSEHRAGNKEEPCHDAF